MPRHSPDIEEREVNLNVFVSHSTKDRLFVEQLAAALEADGFTPWRCEVDIEKGENFVAKINDGLTRSDVALLVWSPDAANSAWLLRSLTDALVPEILSHPAIVIRRRTCRTYC